MIESARLTIDGLLVSSIGLFLLIISGIDIAFKRPVYVFSFFCSTLLLLDICITLIARINRIFSFSKGICQYFWLTKISLLLFSLAVFAIILVFIIPKRWLDFLSRIFNKSSSGTDSNLLEFED